MDRSPYRISLRVKHPSVTPEFVAARLKLKPKTSWTAGRPRASGKTEDYSFCTFPLESPADDSLSEALENHVARLSSHKDFFKELRATQGTIELYVGWFVDRHAGDVFESTLLRDISSLGVDLTFEIYGPDEKPLDGEVLDFRRK